MKKFIKIEISQSSYRIIHDYLLESIKNFEKDIKEWFETKDELKQSVLSNVDELKKLYDNFQLSTYANAEVASAFRDYIKSCESGARIELYRDALLELFGFGG